MSSNNKRKHDQRNNKSIFRGSFLLSLEFMPFDFISNKSNVDGKVNFCCCKEKNSVFPALDIQSIIQISL